MTDGGVRAWPRRRNPRAVLLPVLGMCFFAACGLVLVDIGTNQVGSRALAVGAVAALLPVAPVVAVFLWADRWEPEPPKLLLAAFAWGACVAALIALAVNDSATATARALFGAPHGDVVGSLVSAPFTEEAVKALFVLGVWRLLRTEFDGVIDGVVYAGITAVGFAFTENIYYFGLAFSHGGLGSASGGVIAAFLVRGVSTPFVHPLFSMMTGVGIGIAAGRRTRWIRVCAPLGGYLLAVGLHSLWNAMTTTVGVAAFRGFYFLVVVPILLGAVLFVGWQRRLEQRVVSAQLPDMVARGLVAPSEVDLLTSLSGRRRWRSQVGGTSGRGAAHSVRRYQASVSELAFLRDRISRGTAAADAEDRGRTLVADLVAARSDAVSRAG